MEMCEDRELPISCFTWHNRRRQFMRLISVIFLSGPSSRIPAAAHVVL